jgi:hypothetical protein
MSCLPLELIHEVVVNVPSTTDLRTLRQVNKTFNKIATPGAFRVLDVRLNNVHGLENIHNSDNPHHLVEEIVFKYGDKPSDDEEVESVEDSDTRLVKVTTVAKEQDEDECWDSDESGNIWDDYEDESVEEEDSNGWTRRRCQSRRTRKATLILWKMGTSRRKMKMGTMTSQRAR